MGLLLTLACCALAFLAVLGIAALDSHPVAMSGIAFVYVAAALFLLYRFLPNGTVPSAWAAPAALAGALALAGVRQVFLWWLPHLQLRDSQGPYYVSVSFLLLAYFEAFAILGAAFLAAEAARAAESAEPPPADGSMLRLSPGEPEV